MLLLAQKSPDSTLSSNQGTTGMAVNNTEHSPLTAFLMEWYSVHLHLLGEATHSSILAWKIPWMEDPGGLLSMVSQELDMTGATFHGYFPSPRSARLLIP